MKKYWFGIKEVLKNAEEYPFIFVVTFISALMIPTYYFFILGDANFFVRMILNITCNLLTFVVIFISYYVIKYVKSEINIIKRKFNQASNKYQEPKIKI